MATIGMCIQSLSLSLLLPNEFCFHVSEIKGQLQVDRWEGQTDKASHWLDQIQFVSQKCQTACWVRVGASGSYEMSTRLWLRVVFLKLKATVPLTCPWPILKFYLILFLKILMFIHTLYKAEKQNINHKQLADCCNCCGISPVNSCFMLSPFLRDM